MLFGDDQSWWVGGAAGLSALFTGAGAWIITLLNQRREGQRVLRADALKEWEVIATRLQTRVDALEKENNELHRQIAELQIDNVKCKEETMLLKNVNLQFQDRIAALEKRDGSAPRAAS